MSNDRRPRLSIGPDALQEESVHIDRPCPPRSHARAAAVLLSPLLACAAGCASLGDAAAPGLRSIRGEALSARIRFLSDDLLEGRFTGSRGHAIAERYVASALQAAGAEPAGEGGSWLQPVPLRAARNDAASASLALTGGGLPDETLVSGRDYLLFSDLRTPRVDVSAPLVFAGYGVVAPEYGYDDLAGVDVRGKIAVLFLGAPLSDRPDFFPPIAHAVFSNTRDKLRRLAQRGAVGVLTVFRPEDAERLPWARFLATASVEQMAWLDGGEPDGSPPGLALRGVLHYDAFERLLARAGRAGGLAALDQLAKANALKPFALNAGAHGTLRSDFRELRSSNVLGVLRGSDPKLRDEYVVYSAHLDHLGFAEPIGGDSLYNGALDNASGVASLLELARAFAALPQRPARSILFCFVTGEERGLLGSDYFARHPTVPRAALAANINLDMLVSLQPLLDVVPLGVEHSTLQRQVREAASTLHLALSPDPQPRQVSFIRSDQYSFVRQGVPAVVLRPGLLDASGERTRGLSLSREWIKARYHSPKDEWDPGYDYEAMAKLVRANFLIGLSVAQDPERPRWNPGDFFARYPLKE